LEREAAKGGLKVNEQNTNYMIAARNDVTIHNLGQSMAIGDKHFEVVKEFVYLGSLTTNDVSLEIQRRIQIANRCFFGLRKHLRSSLFSHQTKFTIHKTLIRPVLHYGSGTWVLATMEKDKLLVFERNGVYRKRYNHELDKEFNSPIALKVTKTSSVVIFSPHHECLLLFYLIIS
jgi:hypothetical protein